MKKVVTIIIAVIIAIILGCGFYYKNVTKTPLRGEEVVIDVEEGDSLYSVLNTLNKQGVLKNRMLLGIYVKLNGVNASLVPGTFTVPGDSSIEEVIHILEEGKDQSRIAVTIPEGYNIESMASLFEENGMFSSEEFLTAVKEYKVPDYIPVVEGRKYDLEGFLFPDTYTFKNSITPKEVIDKMLGEFNTKMNNLLPGKTDKIYEIITKASVIEREAVVDDERPIIASVINNRISQNMKLQIDATVIYALGEHVDTVLYEHLEVDSPYNTYKNYGLPVGPICSPGIASIQAVIHPESTDYLYYLLTKDGTGKHYFTNNDVDFENKKIEFGY